eukprot:9227514-Alexandrium_andersonii.AAC.1
MDWKFQACLDAECRNGSATTNCIGSSVKARTCITADRVAMSTRCGHLGCRRAHTSDASAHLPWSVR